MTDGETGTYHILPGAGGVQSLYVVEDGVALGMAAKPPLP